MTSMDGAFLERTLAAWRADSLRPPRPAAVNVARAAMLAAAATQRRPHRLVAFLALRPRHRRAVLGAALTGSAACAVLGVTVAGWSSPSGSLLHPLRLARERVELVLPGVDGASLRLEFAEDRLADARAGHDPAGSLAEARSLLAAVQAALPADHGAEVWERWTADEIELAALEAEGTPNPPNPSASPTPGRAAGGAGTGSTPQPSQSEGSRSGEPAEQEGPSGPAAPNRGDGPGDTPAPGERQPGSSPEPQPSSSASPRPTQSESPEPADTHVGTPNPRGPTAPPTPE